MWILGLLEHNTHINVHIFCAIDFFFLRLLTVQIVPQSFVGQFAQEKTLQNKHRDNSGTEHTEVHMQQSHAQHSVILIRLQVPFPSIYYKVQTNKFAAKNLQWVFVRFPLVPAHRQRIIGRSPRPRRRHEGARRGWKPEIRIHLAHGAIWARN